MSYPAASGPLGGGASGRSSLATPDMGAWESSGLCITRVLQPPFTVKVKLFSHPPQDKFRVAYVAV